MIFILGFFALVCALLYRHSADTDLWAKLSIGQQLLQTGALPTQDHYAFTKTFPVYVDHEWGAGTVFYALLKYTGTLGLLAIKLLLPVILILGIITARRQTVSWSVTLLLSLGAGACLLLAFTPVIRSHVFTYFLFAVTLFLLEKLRTDIRPHWGIVAGIVLTMLVWVNLHGGFAAGLGATGVYAAWAILQKERGRWFSLVLLPSVAVTCVNPYGISYWKVILPALTEKRELIGEWKALPILALDNYLAFRILFGLCVVVIIIGCKKIRNNIPGFLLLLVTAYLGWTSRRHAAFFGIATLFYSGLYFQEAIKMAQEKLALLKRLSGYLVVLGCYTLLTVYAVSSWLPGASTQVLAPIVDYPVREVDILSLADASGNLATPFHWGSYCSWRLTPKIKVSCDGRYEAVYPEDTFRMNQDFYTHQGTNWDRLLKTYQVDYIVLDLRSQVLQPSDLLPYGYRLIWMVDNVSALLCKTNEFNKLHLVATNLPPYTIDPFTLHQ